MAHSLHSHLQGLAFINPGLYTDIFQFYILFPLFRLFVGSPFINISYFNSFLILQSKQVIKMLAWALFLFLPSTGILVQLSCAPIFPNREWGKHILQIQKIFMEELMGPKSSHWSLKCWERTALRWYLRELGEHVSPST